MTMKEMNMKELEMVNGGEDKGSVVCKPVGYPMPQPVGYPMPRPNNIVKPFPGN